MSVAEAKRPWLKLSRGRWAWLFALSLLCSPAVYLYLGYPRRAVAVILVTAIPLAMIIFGPTELFEHRMAFGLFALCLCFLFALPAFDVLRLSGQGRAAIGRPYQRWWVYVGLALLLAIPGEATVQLRQRDLVTLRSFSIPSQSMEPSLLLGDLIFSVMNPWRSQPIQRGEIVYFLRDRTYYVKRVIGLPGDTVEFVNGRVRLNGQPLDRMAIGPWAGRHDHDSSGVAREGTLYRETIPDGPSYEIGKIDGDDGPFDNTAPMTTPPDSIFVLGDNRDNSLDSRMPEMGFIPISSVKGRPIMIFWSSQWGRVGVHPR
jgi:signal peptidase I